MDDPVSHSKDATEKLVAAAQFPDFPEFVEALREGADPNTMFGREPLLYFCVRNRGPGMVSALLSAGAKVPATFPTDLCTWELDDWFIASQEDEELFVQKLQLLFRYVEVPLPREEIQWAIHGLSTEGLRLIKEELEKHLPSPI